MTATHGLVSTICRIAATCMVAAHAGAETDDTIRTGDLKVEMTLAELVGEPVTGAVDSVIASDERIQWETYVPSGYDESQPAGLLVYISPTQSGEMPRGWKKVLDRHNVIWMGANRSGNRELVARRVLLAILATAAAKKRYRIDEERIYVTGLSGGGKTASMVAIDQPQLFRGAIYNCGVELWDRETPKYLELAKRNHFVFITGTLDQALEPTKEAFRAYQDAGIENSKLMVVRDMTHRNPNSFDFEEALEYLDSRLQAETAQ